MTFSIRKLTPSQWATHFAAASHLIAFGETRSPELDRIDYALIMTDDKNEICAYMTCIEMDAESVYWQFGGAMPNYKNTLYSVRGYELFVKWARENYKRISTRIENTNLPMLRLAMKMGFLVTGTTTFKNKIYLELLNEFSKG